MTIRNLNRMFAPKSVALIGDIHNAPSAGAVTAQNLISGGFAGQIDFVNAMGRGLEGFPAWTEIAALPGAPDLAIVASPPQSVVQQVSELGKKGNRAVVIISPEFVACDPGRLKELSNALLEAAGPYLLRIIGPDSSGLMVPRLNLNAGLAHLQPLPGRLAFVTQSNAVLASVLDWATHRRIGFSHAVCLGDMVDVDFGDMLDYLAADHQCRAILLYMEHVRQARKFMSAARAAARIKPVIVVRTGRFREVTPGSGADADPLLDTDAAYDAAFARAGILRVRDLKALFDSVATLSMIQPVNDNRLAILSNGGGIGVLAADALLEKEGRLAALSPSSIASLNAVLPATWSGANPVDIRPDAQTDRYVNALEILLDDPGVDAVLVQNAPSALAARLQIAEAVADLVQQRAGQWKPANVVTCWTGDGVAQAVRQMFADRHIPSYETPEEAVRGFMQMFRYRRSQEILLETPPSIPSDFAPRTDQARQVIEGALAQDQWHLTGDGAAALLETYGITVASGDMQGDWPSAGPPLSMGMIENAVFGPLIYFGHGGRTAAMIRDQALALPPLNMKLARELMRQTRIFRLLDGSGDGAATVIEAIAFTLVKLSQLVCDQPAIRAVHINPLLAATHGIQVLEARVDLCLPQIAAERRMAICAYPKELESQMVLPDGRTILLRPVRPEDAPAFQEIFAGLSAEAIRFRFLHPMNLLPHKEAARLTQIDYDREMALVLAGKSESGQPQLFGSVRISADPDLTAAEYAILLRGDMTGMGLGPMLMRRIIEYARSRGIRRIHGDVLDDNRPMLALCKALGFKRQRDLDDPGVVKVCLDL